MIEKHVATAIKALIFSPAAHTATVYVSPTYTVRATRRRFKGPKRKAPKSIDIVLTMGRPNAAARDFIKLATRAHERFPIRRPQLSGLRPCAK